MGLGPIVVARPFELIAGKEALKEQCDGSELSGRSGAGAKRG